MRTIHTQILPGNALAVRGALPQWSGASGDGATDLDALPVGEKTSLAWASTARQVYGYPVRRGLPAKAGAVEKNAGAFAREA